MKYFISFILTAILALYAYKKQALTDKAIVVAFLFTYVITIIGDYGFYVMICLVFLSDKLFAKITKRKSDKCRNAFQIIAILGMAFIGSICYQITKDNKFLVIVACCLAGGLSDTLASTIGSLTSKCFDIITLKKGTKGLSGNISFLGLGASLLGSLIIADSYFFIVDDNFFVFWLITILGLLGSIADSVMGSLFQVKYQCKKCEKTVEERKHCGVVGIKIRGFTNINNVMVNFLESVIIFIICLLVL